MPSARCALVILLLLAGCEGRRPAGAAAGTGTARAAGATVPQVPSRSTDAPATPLVLTGLQIEVKNALPTERLAETISVRLDELVALRPTLERSQLVVQDSAGAIQLSQLVDTNGDEQPDELVFQTRLAPGESKTYRLARGARSPLSHDSFKVYGRFVRERHDDFVWENDRAAHRMYGPALETAAKDPLVSSGIDVWVKRTPRLVVNNWYQSGDYHRDNGDGGDFYSVGATRGCGGLGIWDGQELSVSRNFTRSRVLANGPIRLIFELEYAAWTVSGVRVSETKRVTVDAGQRFDRFESKFTVDGKPTNWALAVGIAKHEGIAFESDVQDGTLRSWEPFSGDNGHLGCAVVAASATGVAETKTDRLLLLEFPRGAPATYLIGVGWDKASDVPHAGAWAAQVKAQSASVRSPISVSLASISDAPSAQRQ
jgi:hypothetical protein